MSAYPGKPLGGRTASACVFGIVFASGTVGPWIFDGVEAGLFGLGTSSVFIIGGALLYSDSPAHACSFRTGDRKVAERSLVGAAVTGPVALGLHLAGGLTLAVGATLSVFSFSLALLTVVRFLGRPSQGDVRSRLVAGDLFWRAWLLGLTAGVLVLVTSIARGHDLTVPLLACTLIVIGGILVMVAVPSSYFSRK